MRNTKWLKTAFTVVVCAAGVVVLVRAVLCKLQPPLKKQTVTVPMRDSTTMWYTTIDKYNISK